MASTDELISYTSELVRTHVDGELQQRLGLYQVFLKLYDQHRGLLDEILSLENSVDKTLARVTLPYVQGVTLGQQAYLVTNLLQGKTQALMQPQQTWLLGRDPRQVNIPLQDNRVSRCHAAFKYVENQGFYLLDLNSSNGSFVNGEPIRHAALLRDGDRVRLGNLTFAFFLCQSVRAISPLSPEIPAYLEDWQPLPSDPQPYSGRDFSSPDATESSASGPNPFEETSHSILFMQPGRSNNSSSAQ